MTKILGSVNPDVSSDSDTDDDGKPKFPPVSLSAASRNIIRMWLAQARRRKRLHDVVQPLINAERKNECEQCLSRKALMVELVIPLEKMGDRYEKEHKNDKEFDQIAWKAFWKQHQKYRTLCLDCVALNKAQEQKDRMEQFGVDIQSDSDGDKGNATDFGPVYLSAASHAIARLWYHKAQDRIFGKTGRRRKQVEISDDEDDIHDAEGKEHWSRKKVVLDTASKAMLVKWIRMARSDMQKRGATKSRHSRQKNIETVRNQRKKPARKAPSGKKSKMRRK